MKHPLPQLDGLKVFEASARLLSFTKAADELCITKGAVSYQIRQLETQLGFVLFRRTTRQIFLTDAGQTLFQTVREVFEMMAKTVTRLQVAQLQDIAIAATTYVAARWLSPRVAKFIENHPQLAIRFEHGVNHNSFRSNQTDISLVWGSCSGTFEETTVAQLPMPLFPVANAAQSRKLQQQPDRLQQITLLCENRSQDLWSEWFNQPAVNNPRQVIEDANVRVQAAIDGQGMILADGMMQNEIDSGQLIAPFNRQLDGYGYQLRKSNTADSNRVVGEMIDWLKKDMLPTAVA